MRPTSAAQRQHLRKLARHVNAAGLAQRAANEMLRNMRMAASQLRENRRHVGAQLQQQEEHYGHQQAHEQVLARLREQCTELDTLIEEANQDIARQDEVTTMLTNAAAPLSALFSSILGHLNADPTDFGLASMGMSVESTTVIDLPGRSDISPRALAAAMTGAT